MSATYFVALPFVCSQDGEILPGEPKECPTAASAVSMARVYARTPPMCEAVAFSRTGEPSTGEFTDAQVLLAVGTILTMDDLIAAATST